MHKRLFNLTFLVTLTVILGACSWFKEKPPEYLDAPEDPPISVPEDLDPPRYLAPIVILHPDMRKPSTDELSPGPPRVVSTGGGEANAYLGWSKVGVYLEVKDTPESVARRLAYVIERSGMYMKETGPNGEYRFEYVQIIVDDRSIWQKMAFWRRDKTNNYSGNYRTRVEGSGELSRVYLMFDSGESATTSAAEHILGVWMDRLG